MRLLLLSTFAVLLFATGLPAAHTVTFTVSAGKHDRKNEPVCVPLALPAGVEKIGKVTLRDARTDKVVAAGQITGVGLVNKRESKATHELHFILPALKAGSSLTLTASIEHGKDAPRDESPGFVWFAPRQSGHFGLSFGDRKVLSYQNPSLDESTPAARTDTFKVFHHVYDPTGKRLLTKGPGGLYTHHRGLFYGFMKATYGKNTVDIWHCPPPGSKNEAHQAHRAGDAVEQGPVLGRHRAAIDWNGIGKKTFAKELRELTAYNVPGGTLIEFTSLLTPTEEPVKLDGDPQHAGFHFRAVNDVAEKSKDQTIFIRPNGIGKPGTEVNWPANKKHVDLPWLAMSFVVGGKRYTAAYLDKPTNPKEARFSERTYGRIGSYFVTTVTKDKPLLVNYRVWLQEGQMSQDEVAARSRAFVEPATVKVK
jgi:hypothetical protein